MKKLNFLLPAILMVIGICLHSCDKDDNSEKQLQMSTEYQLPENVDFSTMEENKLYIIRTKEELAKYIPEGDIPEIDFTTQNLMVAKGEHYSGIHAIQHTLYKSEKGDYTFHVYIYPTDATVMQPWTVATLVSVIPTNAKIDYEYSVVDK